ncbi:MAG: IS701 family transposase [Deltaproteobacteria bacterium]|nr:IS701 family transposase [Deltaproteobacteria bacterium]
MIFKDEYDKTFLEGDLADFPGPARLRKVDETPGEAFWDHLVREYHYLGSENMIGSRVKYLIYLGARPVGAISFCSAAYRLGLRDLFVGWDDETRSRHLPSLLNNNRFLILPWIRIRNLASHALALALRRVSYDWKKQYGVEPTMVETFVDRDLYKGVCYRAANWTYLGTTRGFGKTRNGFVFHGRKKDLYVMVMSRRFARLFRPDARRLPDAKADLLKMINGIPVPRPDNFTEFGVTELAPGIFDQTLAEHLCPHLRHFSRKEHARHFINMMRGLLGDSERKSVEPIALAFAGGGGEVRNMANFMTRARFDDDGMLKEHQRQLAEMVSGAGGMITVDCRHFPKRGANSAGVLRQPGGPRGKVENCQVAVMVGYAGDKGRGLVDRRLYMPEKWFDDDYSALREECKVPEGSRHETKNVMASEMIAELFASGLFDCEYLGADASFGSDPDFLDSLPEWLIYFANVRDDVRVFEIRPGRAAPGRVGKGGKPRPEPIATPRKVGEIASDTSEPWRDVVLGIGAEGPIMARDKRARVVEVRNGMPGKEVWLYALKLRDGSVNHALCNAPPDATPEEIRTPARMRLAVEQCFRECEKHLGMNHYEVRSWPGWHRHVLFTFMAHLFVNKLRRKPGVATDTRGPAPFVKDPAPTDDWRKAAPEIGNDRPARHPETDACPKGPRRVPTVGPTKVMTGTVPRQAGEAFEKSRRSPMIASDPFSRPRRGKS